MRDYLNQVPKRIQMLDLASTHFQEAKISSQPFCSHRTQEKPPLKAMWREMIFLLFKNSFEDDFTFIVARQ